MLSFVTELLSTDYKSPIKRFQEIVEVLSRDFKSLVKRLQESYQQKTKSIIKMIEYLNFFILCTFMTCLLYLYIKTKKYFPIIKTMDMFVNEDATIEIKTQKLLECAFSGNSKQYLGKIYSKEQITKLDDDQINKLFSQYECKLSAQMVKSLGKSIIHIYAMGTCSLLGIDNQTDLELDLADDPFLNSALQRFTCDLYYRFGSFLTPVSVGLITSRHYFQKKNIPIKNAETRNNSSSDDKGPEENCSREEAC